MSIVVFQHEELEHGGRLGEVLRDEGHRLEVIRLYDGDEVPVDLDDVDGVVSMGGTANVDETEKYPWIQPEMDFLKRAVEAEVPVVGVCLGCQLLAVAMGGEAGPMEGIEAGWDPPVESSFFGTMDPILAGIPWRTRPVHMHGYEVTSPPAGGTPMPLQSSSMSKVQAFRVGFNAYGFQYHFELVRNDLAAILEDSRDWLASAGHDAEAIKRQCDEHYSLYRHLGDRLCRNLATLVFPLDKRRSA